MAENKKSKRNTAKKKAVEPVESFFASPLFLHGLIWAILSVFTSLFMYMNTDALIAGAIRKTLGGILGLTSFAVPLIFIGTFIYLIKYKSIGRLWLKFLLCVAETADLAAIIGLFADYDTGSAFRMCSTYMNGGGVIGVGIASGVSGLIGEIGAFLVFFVLFILLGCLISNVNIIPYLKKAWISLGGYSTDVGEMVKRRKEEFDRKRHEERGRSFVEDDEIKASDRKSFKYEPIDEELPLSLSERRRNRKTPAMPEDSSETVHKKTGNATIDIANSFSDDLNNDAAAPHPDMFDDSFNEKIPVIGDRFSESIGGDYTDRSIYTDFEEDNTTSDMPVSDVIQEDNKDVVEPETNEVIDDDEPSELLKGMSVSQMTETPKAKKLTESEKMGFHEELDKAIQADEQEYRFPTLDLLEEPVKVSVDQKKELYRKAEQLISVLDNFNVKARPVQVTQGPTVTRYEIQPSSGTKLSKIVGLADDIALNMAVSTVLIAPVPGKAGTVGVEIPNSRITPVKIREMLESEEFINAKSKLTVCLGKDIGGNVVVGDIAKWPHALIAGATGSGKSVCINTIIISILYKASPNEVKLIMVDPKQVELGVYNGIPHLLIPVVTEAKKAAGALNWAVSEMMKRYELFKDAGVRKLEVYNKLMEKTGGEKLPQIVIIIDELADLMMVAAKEVEDYICRLAQLARAAGIHLIIATQRPSVDVVTGLIKANIPSRIAFFVSQQIDSRTIIDKAGAEKLLGMGDMLYYPTGARSTTRVQGAFVSDSEVERIVDYIKSTSPETHYSEDLEEHIERIALGENGVTPDTEEDGDELLPEAIRIAVERGKISTSMLQRRLGVGYSRAGRIMDQMEARGIVSPQNGSKPRDVLVSHADMDVATADDNII